MLVTSGDRRFMLSTPGGATSQWVGVGDSFQDWNLASFSEKDGTLILKKSDGTELDLVLASSKVGAAEVKATVADAQRVMEKIHFGEMLGKVLEGQRTAQIAAIRGSLAKQGKSQEEIEKIIAKQTKLMNRLWSSIDMKDLQNSMAQIYSEEFTADQLQGISEFYDTSAGKASLDKAPEIQQKLMKVMMPKLMAAGQQIQAEEKAQKAAANQATTAAPAATASPAVPPVSKIP